MLPVIGIVLVPGILWGWFFYNLHRYKKVRISLLLILFVGGMGSGFFALVLNHIIEKYTLFWPGAIGTNFDILGKNIPIFSSVFWFFVGINEEFAKFIVLMVFVFPSRHLGEKFDGILFSVIVALGFAVMENFYYLDHYGITVVIMRTIITVPAHAFMSIPMGYFVAKSRLAIDSRRESKFGLINPCFLLFFGLTVTMRFSFLHFFLRFYIFILTVTIRFCALRFLRFYVSPLIKICLHAKFWASSSKIELVTVNFEYFTFSCFLAAGGQDLLACKISGF